MMKEFVQTSKRNSNEHDDIDDQGSINLFLLLINQCLNPKVNLKLHALQIFIIRIGLSII